MVGEIAGCRRAAAEREGEVLDRNGAGAWAAAAKGAAKGDAGEWVGRKRCFAAAPAAAAAAA